MQISSFEGGLNTRVAPHLIQSNQSVTLVNVDLTGGQLKSVKGLGTALQAIDLNAVWYKAQQEWVSSVEERDYLEYQGKLYWTRNGAAQEYDGTTIQNMGIQKPTVGCSVTANGAGTGGQDGVYQYAYSYYNDNTGIESSISPLSAEVTLDTASATVNFTASSDPQVTNIRIYRIGGTWTDFLLVETVANTTSTYLDILPDEDLKGRLLGNVTNEAPPENLRYLTERYGTFYGALGSLVYYTKGDGYPQYWPAENYFEFFEDVTSLVNIPEGLLIFTENSTNLLVGSDALSYNLIPIERSLGSINHKATVPAKTGAIVLSHDGFYFATANGLESISIPALGQQVFDVVKAIWLNNIYYAQLSNGKTIVYDLRFSPIWYYLDFATNSLVTDYEDLFYIKLGQLYKAFDGDLETFTYKSGRLTEGAISVNKQYNKVYAFVDGTFDISLSLDGSVVNAFTVATTDSVQLTPEHTQQRGFYFEIEISGVGEVLEINFQPDTL